MPTSNLRRMPVSAPEQAWLKRFLRIVGKWRRLGRKRRGFSLNKGQFRVYSVYIKNKILFGGTLMHASVFKRTLVFLLALVLLATSLPFLGTNVQAAASSAVASKVCANLPILTYAMPLSGVCRNYPGTQQHCSQCPVSGTLGKEKRRSGIRDLILHRNTAACSVFLSILREL